MIRDRRSFRLALLCSVGLHAGLGVLLVRFPREVLRPHTSLSTQVSGPAHLTWNTLQPDLAVEPPAPPIPTPTQVPDPPAPPESTPTPVAEASPATGQRPIATAPPRLLPNEIVERIRRGPAMLDPQVQPAAAFVPVAPRILGGGEPMHGSLAQGQTIVYVLDASGSMGQGGKLERAKRALLATLREQPEAVRFQVVVYAGFARRLLPDGGCIPASFANVERTAQALLSVEPVGRSAHGEALRLAAQANPEFVMVLTDTDDLPGEAIRELTARLARPAVVTVAVVKADAVATPKLVTSR